MKTIIKITSKWTTTISNQQLFRFQQQRLQKFIHSSASVDLDFIFQVHHKKQVVFLIPT